LFIEISAIRIEPDRQRKDLGNVTDLAASFQSIGQIQPIVVAPEADGYLLLAGERRLTAAKSIGWLKIEAKLLSELSEAQRTLVELEENIKRKQLSWQEEVAAVARYSRIMKSPLEQVAFALGSRPDTVSKQITVAEALEEDSKYGAAGSWSSAYTLVTIDQKRKVESAMEEMAASPGSFFDDELDKLIEAEKVPEAPVSGQPRASTAVAMPQPVALDSGPAPQFFAIEQSFLDFAPDYVGKRFNLIHCDFPYGLNMDTANLQNSAARWDSVDPRYADSPELFDTLVRAFFDNQDKFIGASAHCIFWLTPKNYGKIASRFAHFGWTVCETPLIWHKSDNAGIAPDVRRWPRRTFEMAVFASRGDRNILKVKAASYAGPTTKEHHLSEKPLAMLQHFFEMMTDAQTDLLDPTCGGGNALRAAKLLGARCALGLDVQTSHVEYTNKMVK
jgi:ParB family chromosome partitioning protein